jgi:hypothetical protein
MSLGNAMLWLTSALYYEKRKCVFQPVDRALRRAMFVLRLRRHYFGIERRSARSKQFPYMLFDLGNVFTGLDDPEFGVLKFTPWRIDLFDIANSANRRVWLVNDTA